MASEKMLQLLNDQINRELYSVNLYLSMASYCLSEDLDGFANFYRVQAQEETFHAMKQFDYIHQVEGKVTMQALPQPPSEFSSLIHLLEQTILHEKVVSKAINELAHLSLTESDFATHTFLQWFITEQVEEENTMQTLLKKLKMIGDNQSALYLMNEELGRRVFTPPKA
jgi:ferritin